MTIVCRNSQNINHLLGEATVLHTSAAVADRLFMEMCDRGASVDHTCDSNPACKYGVHMNKYYIRALDYARRISLGDFSSENAKYKPVFEIDFEDFSPELRAQLLVAKESLDTIVKEAVFRLFRARHKMVFFDHIQPDRLRWRINGVP